MGRPQKKHFDKSFHLPSSYKTKNVGDSSKGQGFAQSRKKKCLKKYRALIKKQAMEGAKEIKGPDKPKRHKKQNKLQAAQRQFKMEKKAKEQKIKEMEEATKKHRETVMKNIKKRKEVNKALSRRTKKGQPVMKSQIEHMLEKIKAKQS